VSEHDNTVTGDVAGNDAGKVTELHRPIEFTIDGRRERTTVRRQMAADLLRLVGLDPARYDLGRLHGHDPKPTRFADDAVIEIHQGDRFVSIREKADVA
jgi:hypothetical protein